MTLNKIRLLYNIVVACGGITMFYGLFSSNTGTVNAGFLILIGNLIALGFVNRCPHCSAFLTFSKPKHCPACGKEIDWNKRIKFIEDKK